MNAAYSDANKFWADFMEQVNILLDSRRYCRECEILGLKPEYVAEHIVFLGSATMKKVLKDGVSRTLGADVQLYGKRFVARRCGQISVGRYKTSSRTNDGRLISACCR